MTTAAIASQEENSSQSWVRDRSWQALGTWLEACDDLLAACKNQYAHVNEETTSAKDKHLAKMLKWGLRFGGILMLQAGDPDFSDREMRKQIEWRLSRLEFYWKAFTNPLTDQEADKLLSTLFAE